MKRIKALVKPHKLEEVTLALREIKGLSGISMTDVRGFGRGGMHAAGEPPADNSLGLHHYVRLEIACDDAIVPQVIDAIREAAHTGLRGDGKIFVSTVEQAVRISTGERGADAV